MKNVIYKIGNTINDRIYIGSTEKFNIRKNQHSHHLKKGTHHSVILQRHVNKYGFDSVYFEIIESDVINLIEREQFYIDLLNPYFNIRRIAENMKGTKRTAEQKKYMVSQRIKKSGYKKGWSHSQESKDKISKIHKGKKLSTDHIEKFCKANKGRIMNEQTKIKISNKLKGKLVIKETRDKLSVQKLGELNPMFGKSKENHHNFGKKWKCKTSVICKKVIDLSTGKIYKSTKEASELLRIPKSTLIKYILGYNKKITNFKYHD